MMPRACDVLTVSENIIESINIDFLIVLRSSATKVNEKIVKSDSAAYDYDLLIIIYKKLLLHVGQVLEEFREEITYGFQGIIAHVPQSSLKVTADYRLVVTYKAAAELYEI